MNRLEKHSDSVEYLSFDVEESSDDEVIDYNYTANVIGGILFFLFTINLASLLVKNETL